MPTAAFLDARSIVRVIRWDGEAPDRRDWNNIVANAAVRLEVMRDCGVAARIVQHRRDEIARLVRELRALREMN